MLTKLRLSKQKSVFFSSCFSTNNPLRVMFFGSDAISKIVLEGVVQEFQKPENDKLINKLEVVTHTLREKDLLKSTFHSFILENKLRNLEIVLSPPKGMHTPLSAKADKEKLKLEWRHFVTESNAIQSTDKESHFDVGIVCSFGYMIPSFVIDAFKKGMFVIHPSILPKYRGASPLQYALLNGDEKTGVSIIEISKQKFDAGAILACDEYKIKEADCYQDLAENLANLAKARLVDILRDIDGYRKNKVSQDESQTSKAPKFEQEFTYVDWDIDGGLKIVRKFRAFKGTNFRSIRTQLDGKIIFLENIHLASQDEKSLLNSTYVNSKPGSIWLLKENKYKSNVYIKCADNDWIAMKEWKQFDRVVMPAHKFINQYLKKNEIFEKASSEHVYKFEKIELK